MSENIQSISQGTFTIGQTSTTNFVAGPGISITQPSEGTVRIANDETVLWSGARTHSLTSNESIFNFEYIDVYQSLAGTLQCPAQRIDTSNISTEFRIGASYNYDTTMMYYFGSIWKIGSDGKTLTAPNKGNGFQVNLNNGSITTFTNNANNACIMKIVGINRKEV